MKSTLALILAVPLVVLVVYCWWQRRNLPCRVLQNPLLLQSLRVAAVLLMILGAGREVAAQESPEEALPQQDIGHRIELSAAQVEGWQRWQKRKDWQEDRLLILDLYLRPQRYELAQLANLERSLRSIPAPFGKLLRRDLKQLVETKELATPGWEDLVAATEVLTSQGFFDPALDALLMNWYWRPQESKSEDSERRFVSLMAERALVTDALIMAMAEARPITLHPRAWMSKAGPGQHLERLDEIARRDLLKAATQKIAALKRESAPGQIWSSLEVKGQDLWLQDGWQEARLVPEGTIMKLGQFSLVSASQAVELNHSWLGRITVPAKELISLSDWPSLLTENQRRLIAATLVRAQQGDLVAQGLIELSLPFCAPQLRQALATSEAAPGSDAVLSILRRFDGFLPRVIPKFEYLKSEKFSEKHSDDELR